MQGLFARVVVLLPVALTFVPAESVFLMYYLAPGIHTGVALFGLACSLSIGQMLYQFWVLGEVKEMAPGTATKIGAWLQGQTFFRKVILPRTSILLLLLATFPFVRSFGVTLWQTTKHPWGGWLLGVGTVVQLGYSFGIMLGLGQVIKNLFR